MTLGFRGIIYLPPDGAIISSPLDSAQAPIHCGTRSTRNPHPIYTFLSYHRLSSVYVSPLSFVSIPKIDIEALSHPRWRHAMNEKMFALLANET